ncbi:MAG: NnrS family protein [Candidatus Omnitrophica bacterium]|nr:NnrS family protein [Candidatus Omnitrophota bacterium]
MSESEQNCPVVLQTGFRIFFLGAIVYAILSMVIWLLLFSLGYRIVIPMPQILWHGHEMVFGFTMAVVAGFLLTAVINWTGLPTLSGGPLLVLFLFWVAARVLAFMPPSFPVWPIALCNSLFLFFLSIGVMRPIIAAKQWGQFAVISKLLLVFLSSLVFYWGLIHFDNEMDRKALHFAIYMIVGLIFTVGRRILPFFIERGVGYPVTLRNSKVLDMASLVLLVAFSFIDVFWPQPLTVEILSIALVLVHSLRLAGWHTYGIWKKPLLWVLFIGYVFLIIGFVLKFLTVLGARPDDSALHAFTVGGIGVFTLGMMARVSWGHTGRNIAEAPRQLPFIFIPLIAGAVVRVFCPIFSVSNYILCISISQVLWIIAYGFFLILYFPILISPRPDGKRG